MNLNESDFRTLLDATHDHVVAVFSASWCGPCRAFASIFQNVTKQLEQQKVSFAKLDIDECTQLCDDLTINVVPTIIIFKSSKVVARKEGGFSGGSHFIDWLNSQGIKSK